MKVPRAMVVHDDVAIEFDDVPAGCVRMRRSRGPRSRTLRSYGQDRTAVMRAMDPAEHGQDDDDYEDGARASTFKKTMAARAAGSRRTRR